MIVSIPQNFNANNLKACAICRVQLRLSTATAGLIDASNRQAFACISHFSEVELLIVGWADFLARERREYNRQKQNLNTKIYEGWQDARPYL